MLNMVSEIRIDQIGSTSKVDEVIDGFCCINARDHRAVLREDGMDG